MQNFHDPIICLHKDATEYLSKPQRVHQLSSFGVHVIFPDNNNKQTNKYH